VRGEDRSDLLLSVLRTIDEYADNTPASAHRRVRFGKQLTFNIADNCLDSSDGAETHDRDGVR
jgi:hypothetical protein